MAARTSASRSFRLSPAHSLAPRSLLLTGALALGAVAGCVGSISATPSGPGSTGDAPANADPSNQAPGPGTAGAGSNQGGGTSTAGGQGSSSMQLPPAAPASAGRLRLLTRAQLENSLRDLLGDVAVAATEDDTVTDGFASVGATYTTISPRGVEQYESALLAALQPIFADGTRRAGLIGCTPNGSDADACIKSFVSGFGRRAWRRPLTDSEVGRYSDLARQAATTLNDVNAGLMHTTSALLASPNFLYRVELGEPDPSGKGRYRYTGWEMASRLSYLLWSTTPDAELLTAAESGELTKPEGIRSAVTRLLASPRARAGFADNFGRELTGLSALADTPKDDMRFTPTLKKAMEAEVIHLFESRLDANVDYFDMLDGDAAYVNAELAAIYGITGVTGTDMVAAKFPASPPRAGFLGTAAFLSLQSKQDATSPTARGKFIREALLCTDIPDPPDNLDTTLKDPPAGLKPTLREHMDMHRSNPACASCHSLMDPLGYAFESFDWIGAYRDKDNGKPVDTTGDLEGTHFTNAKDFVAALRKSPATNDCLIRNLFRYATGHRDTNADAADLAAWKASFEGKGHQLGAFLAEMTASDGFRTVSPAP